jgi:hypothetical protein
MLPSTAPDKTAPPTAVAGIAPTSLPPSSVPSLDTAPAQPTLPPTSAWLVTTSTLPPPTAPPPTAPQPTAPTTPTTPTSDPVVTTSPTVTPFDGLAFLTAVYGALADDPFTLLDIAEQQTVLNTPAELFVAHLLSLAITRQFDLGMPAPAYTVAQSGKAVQVCADATSCEIFSDFYAPTGLLEMFSIDGMPLRTSGGFRQVNVESLSVESTVCRVLTDGALSCVVLLMSEGAATALHWDQSVFTAPDGRQFPPDLTRSEFTPSIADGGLGSGHVVFPGAPIDGELSLPMVSGLSGAPNVVTIQVREVS